MKKNLYIGGYAILDLSIANVYAQALICAKQNKPVLVYDDPERYYADTIKIDTENDNNVVITKGGKTITINDANSVSSEGEIQPTQKSTYLYSISIDKIAQDTGNYMHFEIYSSNDMEITSFDDIKELLISEGFDDTDGFHSYKIGAGKYNTYIMQFIGVELSTNTLKMTDKGTNTYTVDTGTIYVNKKLI